MRLLSYFLLLGCLTLFSSELFAITFVGGFENNIWGDYRNWSPQTVPGAGDEATVPEGKLVNVNGNITVGTLILGGTLANNADPDSKLTITTGFSLINGSVSCPVYLLQGCGSLWQGASGINGNIFNHGEITVSGNIAVNYAVIRNESDGIMNLSGGAKLQIINNPAVLDNYGLLKRTGVGGGLFEILLGGHTNYTGSQTLVEDGELFAASLDNYAPITIAAGTVFRTNDMRAYDATAITGSGTFISNNNGVRMLNSSLVTVDVAETEINSQGFKETGPITFTQHVVWKAGTLFAQVTFSNGCVVDIDAGGPKGITNTTTNHGTIQVDDSFGFDFGRLDNYGTMNLNGAYTNGIYHASEGIHNYGTIRKPVGSTGTYLMGVQLFNEVGSHLIVEQDELHCSGNLFNAAEILVHANATLRSNFTESFNGGSFGGPGEFIIQNNGFKTSSAASLDFGETVVNANIQGPATLTFTGPVAWIQGDFSGPVNIATSSTVDMNPGGSHGISGTTTNYGIFNINTSFTLSAGQINNHGQLLLNGAHTVGIYFATPGIFNFGTVKKPLGAAGIFNMGVPLTNHNGAQTIVEEGELQVTSEFNNAGLLNVLSGAIFKANLYRVQDGASNTGGGTLVVYNNGLTTENTSNVTFDIAETVWQSTLNGSGPVTFSAHISWENAGLDGTISVTIAPGATIDLTGNGFHYLGGGATLNNHGTMNATVSFGGGTLNNHNVLNLAPGISFGGGFLNNTGTLSNNAGGNISTSYQVNNTGTIHVTDGTFTFSNGLSNAGTVDVAIGANAQLDGYANSIESGSNITGLGTFTVNNTLTVNTDATIGIENFTLFASSLLGTGTLTFIHNFNANGYLQSPILIAAGGTMVVNSVILYSTLTNNGTIQCNADLLFNDNNAILINNAAFLLSSDATLGSSYSYYPQGQFDNTGTIDKSSSGTAYFNLDLNNQQNASLNVQNGVLEVTNLDNSGSCTIASDATLIVKGGSNLTGGTVSGNGTLGLQGQGWHLSNTLVINSLNLEIAGPLSGDPGVSLEIQGTANWLGAEISVPVNVLAGGVFNISTYGSQTLAANLNNAGTLNCAISFNCNGDITNTGSIYLTDDYSGFFNGGNHSLTNSGTIHADATQYNYLYLNTINNGTIDISAGTAYFDQDLENNAAILIAQNAAMVLYGNAFFNAGSSVTGLGSISVQGELTLSPNLTFSGQMFSLNGNLFGPGTLSIQSAMTWEYGDIQTDVTISSDATLQIGNNYGGGGSKSSKNLTSGFALHPSSSGFTLFNTITNNGIASQFAGYYMDGGAFINYGTLNTAGYSAIYNDDAGGNLTNHGSWSLEGSFDCYVNATNNGTLLGESSSLRFEPEWENNGIVSPGFSPGSLIFEHDFVNGTELQMEVQNSDGPGYGHDYIEAQGNIMLGGSLMVSETGLPLNGEYVILHCNGGPGCLTGTFTNSTLPSDYALTYTGEEVILIKGQPASISPEDTIICTGNPVTLTASAGESYQWSTGETTQSIEVYPSYNENYSVTVYDVNGIGSLGNASIQVNPSPYAYINPGYSTLCQGESIELTIYGDGETYLWDNGATTQSITVSPNTEVTYYATVTASGGCSTSVSATVVGSDNPPLVPEITGIPVSMCANDYGIYLSTYQDGVSGEWSGPGVFYGYYFEPAGLSGPQLLTFTPYPGQCAIPATWSIEVNSGTYFEDLDGDGFGNPDVFETTCTPPAGYVADNTDCNDQNGAVNPGATELCNGLDDDCDGLVDEGNICDGDGDGYTVAQGDCDDNNSSIHPDATEICNEIDDDCDGQVDETTLNISLSVGSIPCNGGSAILVASGSGGIAPYQFSLNGGPFGSANSFSVPSGSHMVSIKDAGNCNGTNTIEVAEPEAIVIDPIEITHVACAGGNTGAVNITVSGGTGNYTYQWSNNRTTQDLVNVSANTYTVTVSDANACTASASATVNPKLSLSLSKTNVICNGGSDGTATATANGGTPGYTYIWSNGETTATITGLTAGAYSCTVTDELGCTRTKSISVGQPSAIGISGVVTKVSCYGGNNGAINITINHGVAPFTYTWSDGGTTEDRIDLSEGVYTLLVTDVNGCTREKSFTVGQPSALTLGFNVTDVSCSGNADAEITASVSGGVKYPTTNLCQGERYCFDWSHGDTARVVSGLVAGTYTVTVTDANGCSIIGAAVVTEPSVLDITEVVSEPLPNGKFKLTVTAAGGTPNYKYRRIPGGGYQSSNIFNNVPSGAYEIVVRDHNFCTDTVSIVLGGSSRPSNPEERMESTGIWVVDPENPVSIYPNPASDRFKLQVEQAYQHAHLMFFNAQGKLMLETSFEDNSDLGTYEVGHWESGLYFVVVELDGKRFTQKLMIVSK